MKDVQCSMFNVQCSMFGQGINTGSECVYVRICQSETLENYL